MVSDAIHRGQKNREAPSRHREKRKAANPKISAQNNKLTD